MTDFEVLSNKHTSRLQDPLKCIDFGFSQDINFETTENLFQNEKKQKQQQQKKKKTGIISTDDKLFFTARKERTHKTFFLKKLDISHNAKKRQVQFFFSFQISLFDK